MPNELKQLQATVHGRVQGVSFRYHTAQKAHELNIAGWVMNKKNGTVEVVAEGTEAQLKSLLEFLHIGSPAANVARVDHKWASATGQFTTFKTKYNLSK